ncbi:MAG: S41 family peptidase [Bacillota bacterium]
MDERRESLTLTAVLVVVASMISYVAGAMGLIPWVNQQVATLPGKVAKPPAVTAAPGIDVKKLDEVLRAIQDQYVESVEPKKLTDGALKGMVEALGDRHSAYFTPEQYKTFVEHFEPTFSGIGVTVELSQQTGYVTVVSPIKGSPGERAGLRAGDAIVKVDGRDITNMTLNEAVTLIRGPKGTKVTLTVKREGQEDLLEFTITRDTITMPALQYRMVDAAAGVGYVQFYEFRKGGAKQVQDAINDLRQQGMKRLILDLRQNPGGLLTEAVDVSSLFVPELKPVVHIVDRQHGKKTYPSTGKEPLNLPLVVLVDGGSASASEIVAGAIKDLKIGTLMGTKTFGKGSVQTFWEFPDGSGIKLTTAKYLTAGEKAINGVGIEPDVIVENPAKVIPGEPGDPQLEAAIKYIKALTP